MTIKYKILKTSSLLSNILFSFALINCGSEPIKLVGTKWKTVKVTLDSSNALNNSEIVGFKVLDNLLKSSSLYSEFKDGYVIMHFDGKVADTTTYVLQNDTLFYIQNALRDTNIILKKTEKTLITKSLRGLTAYLEKVN